jgi:glycogen synthase
LPPLLNRGYKFQVLTGHDGLDLPDTGDFKNIPIRRLPFLSVLRTKQLERVMALRQEINILIHAFAPDIIHANVTFEFYDFVHLMLRAQRIPIVTTVHGEWCKQDAGREATAAHALACSDRIAFISHAAREQAVRVIPNIASRSSVIYNGLEEPNAMPTPLWFDKPRLLCLGRLSREKGFDVALTAMSSLVVKFPRLRMVIAGDGPDRDYLEKLASRLQLAKYVDFYGWVEPSRVAALINACTIVLMPSMNEGFGLVALEAALMGRPVVASRSGGLSEVIADEETGLLIDKDDREGGFVKAIARLLKKPALAVNLGQKARARSLEVFSLDRFVDAYDSLYQSLPGKQSLA